MINPIRHILFIKRIQAQYPVSLSVAHRIALNFHKWLSVQPCPRSFLSNYQRRTLDLYKCNDYLYRWDK